MTDASTRPPVLLVNGNTNAAITARLHDLACRAAPDIAFVPVTPAFGPPYVTSPSDVTIAAHAVLDAITARVRDDGDPDGCIIACFGEPGLFGARHAFHFPIVGMADSSALCAMNLGARFAILTLGEHWPAMLQDLMQLYGTGSRCSAIERIPGTPAELLADPQAAARQIAERAQEVARRTEAHSVVLGGAALAGVAALARQWTEVPLIDCLEAAVVQMGAMLRLTAKFVATGPDPASASS